MDKAEIKKLFKILKEIAYQQAICEISGTDWGNKIVADLEDLKQSIMKGKTKIPK